MSGTTTNYGWTYPTSTDYVKDGATAIQTVATGVDTTLGTALNNKLHAGLVLVKTQTIGTGVSSVTVTNAFNATYDAYKIVVIGGVGSGAAYMNLKLGASITGYYGGLFGTIFASSAFSAAGQNNSANWGYSSWVDANIIDVNYELRNPYLAKFTLVNASFGTDSSGFSYSGRHAVASSFTDFTITAGGQTLTGGTIAVYGYAKD